MAGSYPSLVRRPTIVRDRLDRFDPPSPADISALRAFYGRRGVVALYGKATSRRIRHERERKSGAGTYRTYRNGVINPQWRLIGSVDLAAGDFLYDPTHPDATGSVPQ